MVADVLASSNAGQSGGPEGEYYRRLKHYLASHYDVLGLKGQFNDKLEVPLISGDQADLILDHVLDKLRVCAEVKSRISPSGDLVRGIFQCAKYQVVLESHRTPSICTSTPTLPVGNADLILSCCSLEP